MALCHPPCHSDQRSVPTVRPWLREAASTRVWGAESTASKLPTGGTWWSGRRLSHPQSCCGRNIQSLLVDGGLSGLPACPPV